MTGPTITKDSFGMVRYRLMRYVVAIALISLGQLILLPAHAEKVMRDFDALCCLEKEDLEDVFVIKLAGVVQPVGHLSVVTPDRKKFGFDVANQTFSHDTDDGPFDTKGFYALGPKPHPSISSPSWNHDRYLLLFRHIFEYDVKTHERYKIQMQPRIKIPTSEPYAYLEEGKYTVRVIGLWPGRYTLKFYPYGRKQGIAAEFGGSEGIEIKAGETHEYSFDGQSLNELAASAPAIAQHLTVKRDR